MSTEQIVFGPFRFDPDAPQLWKDEQVVAVQPKPLAVLRALAMRPGQVVTKQALLKEVWAGTYVTQAVLKVAIRALREALGERADASQYIQTEGREGYRWIAGSRDERLEASPPSPQVSSLQPQVSSFVGRETELVFLHNLLEKALRGEPQLVFITGEPGIGKTTLLEVFRQRLETGVWRLASSPQVSSHQSLASPLIGHGQCIEQYGQGEPYLPMLEALGRLCREVGGEQLLALLRQYAPTWLVQLSGMVKEEERQGLQLQVQGATQQRMLREIAEALEVGTVQRPLVLLFEDLHWSDSATIEFLAYLAKRRQPMRLLVVATYRPVDVVMGNHPLKTVKQELQAHRLCEEVRLELLKKPEIEEYVAGRFSEREVVTVLAPEVYRRTDGNPLFMVNVVEHFITQGLVVQGNGRWALKGEVGDLLVPENLRQLIAQQVERLSEEQRQVLEGASVVGTEFPVAAVAAAVKQEMEEGETVCEEIAGQGHFLEERGIAEWPDGTISGRYAFRHALYQNVLSERIAEARKIRLHRLIGERLEQGYGEQAKEIAAELAVHFEQGRDYHRATRYLQQAGENANQRSANVEAISHLTKGLELLKTLPDTPERSQQELALQTILGTVLSATKGLTASEKEQVYARALELCRQVGESPQLVPVLCGLALFYQFRAEFQTQKEVVEQILRIAQSVQDPAFLALAHMLRGEGLYFQGELVAALDHLEQGLALYDPQQFHAHVYLSSVFDVGVYGRCFAAAALCALGYPDQALQRVHEALTLARAGAHSYTLALALNWVATIYLMRGEVEVVQERAAALVALATEQGLPDVLAFGTIEQGWVRVQQGEIEAGIGQIRDGLTHFQAAGFWTGIPGYLGMLTEAHMRVGRIEEGLSMVAEALAIVDKTGARTGEAVLYVLKGWLLFFSTRDPAAAEACFQQAIDITRRRSAKSGELLAVTSLSRLWQMQGKKDEARQMLAEIYNWFTEGFDTKALREAKALLEALT